MKVFFLIYMILHVAADRVLAHSTANGLLPNNFMEKCRCMAGYLGGKSTRCLEVSRSASYKQSMSEEYDVNIDEVPLIPKKNLGVSVNNYVRDCYQICPGEVYSSYESYSKSYTCSTKLISKTSRAIRDIRKLSQQKLQSPKDQTSSNKILQEAEEDIVEPSATILSGIVKPLVPKTVWVSLTGREFYFPSTLSALIRTGIDICTSASYQFVDWKAADSKTRNLLESTDGDDSLKNALDNDEILIWIGKFCNDGHGSHLPLIKTVSLLPLSPGKMAALLMDSSKVTLYNKMSLGRVDEVVFQECIETDASSFESKLGIDGEAKIVRNLTKPPLSKKLMEFVTVMYARKLKSDDDVGPGVIGSPGLDGGYIVVSRAVTGGKWSSDSSGTNQEERIRSEILLGVNLIRSIPGDPNKCEVTAVTHCNSPSVPTMLASSIGIKGAVDFIKDIRSLYNQ